MDRRCIKQFKQWLPKEHNNKVELVRVFTLFLPLKKIKIPFQTDQAGGKNLPFQTKTDTCGEKCPFETKKDAGARTTKPEGQISLFKQKRDTCGRKTKLEGKISLFKQKRILVDRAEVVSIHEFILHDPVYSMVQILLTLSTKFSWLPPAFPASITIEIFLLFCCFFFREISGILWEIFYYFSVNEMQIYNRLNIWRSFRRFSALLRVSSNAPRFPKIINFLNVC